MRTILVVIILGFFLYLFWPQSETRPSGLPSLPFREIQSTYNLSTRNQAFSLGPDRTGNIEDRAYSAKAAIVAYVQVNPSASEACSPALDLCAEIIAICQKRAAMSNRLDALRIKVAPAFLAKTAAERQQIERERLDVLQRPVTDAWNAELEAFRIRSRALAEKMKVNEAMWDAKQNSAHS